VTHGAEVIVQETITVPADLPDSVTSLDCEVVVTADGNLLGTQRIHVEVGCTTLTFEELGNGRRVEPRAYSAQGVTLTSSGSNLGLVAFDTTPGGPNDPAINDDMLIGHGNVLLLQDDWYSAETVPGSFDVVTDDPHGGDIIFVFDAPVAPQGLLLADINPPPNQGASVTLVDAAGRTRTYSIEPGWTGTYGDAGPHRLDLRTLAPQPGNGTPRLATASEQAGFQQDEVVRLVVHLTGFGAIDDLEFCR
jgi:hypothetical protein